MELKEAKPDIIACISTKEMYKNLSKIQLIMLEGDCYKKKKDIIGLLISLKHDVLLLNEKEASLDRDLFE